MTDPVSTAARRPRLALGAAAAAYEAAVERARDERLGEPPVRPRRDAVVAPIPASARRSPSASAGSTRRTTSPQQIAGARGVRRRRRRRGFTTAVVAGMGGSSLAPDVLHRTFGVDRGLPRPAHPRLDRPGRRRRRPSTTSTRSRRSFIVATKSGTTTEPNAFLADAWDARRGGARRRSRTTSTTARRASSSRSPTRARASRRSPTTTTSARSSSTRPTSAAATRALTYVGLVPASLIGLDLDALLASAQRDARRLPRARPGGQPRRLRSGSRSARWPRPAATS